MFKNITAFIIASQTLPYSISNLDLSHGHLFEELAIRDVGEQERSVHGWVPVIGNKYAVGVSRGTFFRMCVREKILPPQVIRDEIEKQVIAFKKEMDRNLYKDELTQVRDNVTFDLIRKALVKQTFIDGFINEKYLIVNTASASRAEDFASLLRKTLETLPTEHVRPKNPIEQTLTHWAANAGNVPYLFERTGSYVINARDNNKRLRMEGFQDGESLGAEQYAGTFGTVVEMSVCFDERINFTINDNFTIKRIISNIQDDSDSDNEQDIKLAEMEITASEATDLITYLIDEFGGLQPPI